MIKAIVFDMDGVIVDSEPLHYRAFLRVVAEHGVEFDYARYLERYVGYDDREGFQAILEDFDLLSSFKTNSYVIAELCQKKAIAFEEVLRQGIEPMPGVLALLDQAFGRWPLAIATGATRHDAELLLNGLGLMDRFQLIVTAEDVAKSKPDPLTYKLAVEGLARQYPQLQLQAGECLAIEDTAAGVESARVAGLNTLAVSTTSPPEKLYRAHRIVPNLQTVGMERLREWFD